MTEIPDNVIKLPTHINDNKILNDVGFLKQRHPDRKVVLVTKDINVRLKARGLGIESQDYHNDQLLSDIEHLTKAILSLRVTSGVGSMPLRPLIGRKHPACAARAFSRRSARISLF